MIFLLRIFVICFIASNVFAAPRSQVAGNCVPGVVSSYLWKFSSHRTGYFPENSKMQGGFTDRKGKPLRTLQGYISGRQDYVSAAMDHQFTRLPYGTKVRIPAIEKHFGKCIEFRIVDTGGRFVGRGTAKIDICNDSRANAYKPFSNGNAEIFVVSGL